MLKDIIQMFTKMSDEDITGEEEHIFINEEEILREEYILRFNMLRDYAPPNVEVKLPEDMTSLEEMRAEYESLYNKIKREELIRTHTKNLYTFYVMCKLIGEQNQKPQ